jgi:hypothetical protein
MTAVAAAIPHHFPHARALSSGYSTGMKMAKRGVAATIYMLRAAKSEIGSQGKGVEVEARFAGGNSVKSVGEMILTRRPHLPETASARDASRRQTLMAQAHSTAAVDGARG